MAPVGHHSLGSDVANGIKNDLVVGAFCNVHASVNKLWTMQGGLERCLVCYSERPFDSTTVSFHGCLSTRKLVSDSHSFQLRVNPFKHGLLSKDGGRNYHIEVRAVYNPGSTGSEGANGDTKVQQMLVDMVRIQVGKARMIELLDERSQYMRSIADEALFEYDKIAYRTMKGLDATGSRVLRQLDVDAIAIEKDLRIARAELEAESRDFEEYQIRMAYSRNEGLFFKSLYKAPRTLLYRSASSINKVENKVAAVSTSSIKESSSSYRQLLYGGLSLVMVSFLWSSGSAFVAGTCMRASKLASYGIVFSLLLAQLAYIKVITGEADIESENDSS